jgi:phosphoglycolate phosphatase
MPVTPFRAVVFDFDLTLADTRRGFVECVNYGRAGVGLPPAPADLICRTLGITQQEGFLELAGREHMGRFPQYLELYQERSRQVMEAMTTFYPAAPAVVRQLKESGVRMGILSSGHHDRIEATLKGAGLLGCFETILGFEDVSLHKPDPAGLREVVRRLGGAPRSTLYIGDHVVDAQAAQSAETPFIAVLSGATPREAFAPYPHLAILGDLAELPPFLDQLHQPVGGQT